MRKTDSKQKKRIQLNASKGHKGHGFNCAVGKGKTKIPDHAFQDSDASQTPVEQAAPYHREDKVGRNEPCPCGSGKKYKKCCLAKASEKGAD